MFLIATLTPPTLKRQTIILCLLLSVLTLAAADTTYYKNFYTISKKDKAVIYEIDKSKNGEVKRFWISTNNVAVTGFYLDGKLNGVFDLFYETGQRFETARYEKGSSTGTIKRWYKNGQLMVVKELIPVDFRTKPKYDVSHRVLSYYDAAGNQLVKDGDGIYAKFFLFNATARKGGTLKKGVPDGNWIGFERGLAYNETYKKGKLVRGESKDEEGNTYQYEVLQESASFVGGYPAWGKFLREHLNYPKDAQRSDVEGKVYVRFFIESDGTLTSLKVVKGIGSGCDEEAVRVLKKSPKWKPGVFRGRKIRQKYVQLIQFKLS